ncbi:endonuclease/exonuclease/phosphatase family protein [Kibdelosporangium philippinense]|uniref:Endonuclease/exonuclease/phosphatase family protein n=1 Tax=Kibdelosporangium philippinense TaxID=211113 RepID=A0ABS8Z824_9PSEU|nr:endonuclease/exonuclease/phosphatase family protein [Kibdelosporangium philippinense]MCE7002950.1 endonuclease/exonuclease/phosphatase family protein [Kibdelosporangium philippinense]
MLSLAATLGVSFALLMGTADADPSPIIGPAQADGLHIMSYNLRFASDKKPNSWDQRRPVMAEMLNGELPTIIGTQEGMYAQLQDIDRDLPSHYEWIGVGRQGGTRDEFSAIFYDSQRLNAFQSQHYWLSDTPEVVGSKSWGNTVPRMVTWARFLDLRTGKEFVTVNTHFDNHSEEASIRSAYLVRERLKQFAPGLPVLLIGDFNDPALKSRSYQILVTEGGFADSWVAAKQRLSPLYSTYHGYRGVRPGGNRIDWILTKGASTTYAAINTFASAGQIPSDHFPIHALVTLP